MSKNIPNKPAVKKERRKKGFVKFFREVNSELKKVSWPNKKELTNYTIVVIVIILLFAAVVVIVDFGLGQILDLIIS